MDVKLNVFFNKTVQFENVTGASASSQRTVVSSLNIAIIFLYADLFHEKFIIFNKN